MRLTLEPDRLPPGQNMDDYLTIFRSGMWRLNYKLSREGKTRLFEEFFPLLHDTKHEIMGKRDDDSYVKFSPSFSNSLPYQPLIFAFFFFLFVKLVSRVHWHQSSRPW